VPSPVLLCWVVGCTQAPAELLPSQAAHLQHLHLPPCRDILAKLPEPFDLPAVRRELGTPGPTQVVLLQELERWNAVVKAMQVGAVACRGTCRGRLGCMLGWLQA
jgi:hypothetical protein